MQKTYHGDTERSRDNLCVGLTGVDNKSHKTLNSIHFKKYKESFYKIKTCLRRKKIALKQVPAKKKKKIKAVLHYTSHKQNLSQILRDFTKVKLLKSSLKESSNTPDLGASFLFKGIIKIPELNLRPKLLNWI